MGVYKDNRPTKDGKILFYKLQYQDIDGTHKTKKSGRFATKKEAEDAEFEFKLKLREYENTNNVTFEEMIADYNLTDDDKIILNRILYPNVKNRVSDYEEIISICNKRIAELEKEETK